MNLHILIGNLGKDPELRYTQSGAAVVNFSMATKKRWKKDGEQQERTSWHNIVAWGPLAEAVGKNLSKGSKVMVQGDSHTRSWDGDDGTKKYITEVTAKEIEFLSWKGKYE